jgi:hypothetical protein
LRHKNEPNTTQSRNKKVGNEKIAFSWNLRGGVPTQGHRRARKEIPLHEAAHIGNKCASAGFTTADVITGCHPQFPTTFMLGW